MAKVKYFYNTNSLRYEKVSYSFGQKLWKVAGFLASAILFSLVIIGLTFTYFDSPEERLLKRENNQLQLQYDLLNKQFEQASKVLANLEEKDNNIYRLIFEAEPIPANIREAGYGGVDLYKELRGYQNSEIMVESNKKLEKIRRQLYIQSKSYDDVYTMIKNKEELLRATPAIQPVSNKDLKRIASGFGHRIDPIYKTRKMHYGIDFSAPRGTEIYATADGEVINAGWGQGYGKRVKINHNYGYLSHYAHMSKILVKPGQKVVRGELIGLVGSTGKSTAPHLHYEVAKDGKKINPINYFFNDLLPEEYNKIVDIASRDGQSFD